MADKRIVIDRQLCIQQQFKGGEHSACLKQRKKNILRSLVKPVGSIALGKPFSDHGCGRYLASFGMIMMQLPPPPARILDMGCGGGWTSAFLARCGYVVVGQDIADDMIDLARENQALQRIGDNLTFIVTDFESIDYDEQFDAVIFYDCLHHADDARAALTSAYRALKPGGLLITHEPGEGHATTAEALAAVKMYGVSENDMPPHLIISHGQELGFGSPKIYPLPDDVLRLFGALPRPRSFRTSPWARAKRAWNAAFHPHELIGPRPYQTSDRTGAIVVQTRGQ